MECFQPSSSQYTLNGSSLSKQTQTHVMASTIIQGGPMQGLCMLEFVYLVNEIPHVELDGEVITT